MPICRPLIERKVKGRGEKKDNIITKFTTLSFDFWITAVRVRWPVLIRS